MSQSIADRFVECLAAIKALDTSNLDDPMRHAVRKCKMSAEIVLSHAIDQAWAHVELANMIPDDFLKAIETAKETAK